MSDILPAIFFGHGNPMNALSTNSYTEGWRRLGEQTPRPRAILSFRRTGSCPALESRSARILGRFTTSADFHASCIRRTGRVASSKVEARNVRSKPDRRADDLFRRQGLSGVDSS
jgi:hypothetical protein